jgi:enoyl-CoA hydratase/carnithine racemase
MAREKGVLTRARDGVLTITLNRPEKLNALLPEMLTELGRVIDGAAGKKTVRALILTGAGRAFCSGLDLSFLEAYQTQSPAEVRRSLRHVNSVFNQIEDLEKPVVAALNGITLGAGLELALVCDVRIAAEGAQMGLVETRVGVFPDGGGCARLARHIGLGRAKEMILTGNLVGAEDARSWGLVNRVVPARELQKASRAFALELLQGGPLGIGLAKRVMDLAFSMDVRAGVDLEALATSPLYQSRDAREGRRALRAGRRPRFLGR